MQRAQEAQLITPVPDSGAGSHDGPVARISVSVTHDSGATQVRGFRGADVACIR